jgi:hypothetical protein
LTVDLRIGIGGGHDHAGNTGGQQRVRAGPGASMVAAGFKGYVGGRAPRQWAGLLESYHFRMVALVVLVKALTHQTLIADQHATYGGIR